MTHYSPTEIAEAAARVVPFRYADVFPFRPAGSKLHGTYADIRARSLTYHTVAYLCRPRMPWTEIARDLGVRDHTSVISAVEDAPLRFSPDILRNMVTAVIEQLASPHDPTRFVDRYAGPIMDRAARMVLGLRACDLDGVTGKRLGHDAADDPALAYRWLLHRGVPYALSWCDITRLCGSTHSSLNSQVNAAERRLGLPRLRRLAAEMENVLDGLSVTARQSGYPIRSLRQRRLQAAQAPGCTGQRTCRTTG